MPSERVLPLIEFMSRRAAAIAAINAFDLDDVAKMPVNITRVLAPSDRMGMRKTRPWCARNVDLAAQCHDIARLWSLASWRRRRGSERIMAAIAAARRDMTLSAASDALARHHWVIAGRGLRTCADASCYL